MIPRENLAVVARRHEPADSLDFFPTPPWATRALLDELMQAGWPHGVFGDDTHCMSVLDPCCGEGHMAGVLQERFSSVASIDIHDYGYGGVRDFLDMSPPDLRPMDWVIMNPPFGQLEAFIDRALNIAQRGVAVLCRTQALEGINRHRDIWAIRPPTGVFQFAERVPMHAGRWVINGSTATGYMWLVWEQNTEHRRHNGLLRWIAPGARKECSRDDDPARFNGVYQLKTLISPPKAKKKKWKTTFHTPAEWAAMGRAA